MSPDTVDSKNYKPYIAVPDFKNKQKISSIISDQKNLPGFYCDSI